MPPSEGILVTCSLLFLVKYTKNRENAGGCRNTRDLSNPFNGMVAYFMCARYFPCMHVHTDSSPRQYSARLFTSHISSSGTYTVWTIVRVCVGVGYWTARQTSRVVWITWYWSTQGKPIVHADLAWLLASGGVHVLWQWVYWDITLV